MDGWCKVYKIIQHSAMLASLKLVFFFLFQFKSAIHLSLSPIQYICKWIRHERDQTEMRSKFQSAQIPLTMKLRKTFGTSKTFVT